MRVELPTICEVENIIITKNNVRRAEVVNKDIKKFDKRE